MILGAAPRRARGWRRAIMLVGVLALAIAPCACTASGRPGGHAVILEFSRTPSRVLRPFADAYLHAVVPRVAALLGGDPAAYRYLPASIARFPDAPALAERLRGAGFASVRFERLDFGTVAIHVADR